MKIRVRLLGFYQMMLGKMYEEVELLPGANLEDLWIHFKSTYRQLQDEDMKAIAGMSVNGRYIKRDRWTGYSVKAGDRVDLLSQMGGG